MQKNINEIETDVLNHGVVGTVKKNIAEGRHRQGFAYIAGRIVGYGFLLAVCVGFWYMCFHIAGMI